MSNARELIPLLDAVDALPAAQALRSRSYELLRLSPGASVVDVGCGAGLAVRELAGQGVRAIGVDLDDEMIAVAKERYPSSDFRPGTAYELPLNTGEVTGYRADKVLHELADAGQALREAARVLAPGGRIVLIGQDWDTFVIDSDRPELTRAIVHARADLITSPRAARRYRNLLLECGFESVEVEVRTAVFTDGMILPLLTGAAHAALDCGAITQEQHDSWTAEQKARAGRDRLFLALPMFVVSATGG
ncbi:methyltransferase domain-containing protein [Planobispora siamensis]|nr:methyltransferase domain-containing protein [Planobispora siamensis]